MAKDEGRKDADKDGKDDEDDIVEEFTDLRDGRDTVEVPDSSEDALDALSMDDDETGDDPDADADPAEGDTPDADAEADAAAQAETAAAEAAKAKEDDFRARNFERKKLTLSAFAAQAETLEVKEAQAKTAKATAERILAAAPARIKAAKEAGDTDAELAAQGEVLDARDHLKAADAVLDSVASSRPALLANIKRLGWNGKSFDDTDEDKAEIAKVTGGKATGDAKAGAAKPSKNSAAFVKANAWFVDPKHAKDAALLRKMDVSLRAEGNIDVDDPKYFTTLVRRFNEVKPGLARDLSGKQVASGERERGRGRGTPMASGGLRSGDDGAEKGGEAKLTNADIKAMRQFGFDPQNKKHRANWLTEKKALSRQEARA